MPTRTPENELNQGGPYPDDFNAAMVDLLDEEGGYSNDPDDPGGETKWGIDKASYPNVDIKNLTVEGAKAIYWRDWWSPLLDHGVPPKTLAKLFDVSVNIGKGPAYKFLQRAIFTTADGQLGPLTQQAIVNFPLVVTLPADQFVRGCIRMQQYGYYEGLVAGNPRLKKYISGWLARASRMFGNVSQTISAKGKIL